MEKTAQIRAFNRYYTRQTGLLDQIDYGGLTLSEARILFEIGSLDRPSAREIKELLGLDEGYMSRVVKKLEKLSLISRAPAEEDARIYRIHLTQQGQDRYSMLVEGADNAVQSMISTLPETTVDQLLESMKSIQTILSWPNIQAPTIREIEIGDLGWVIKRHGELYAHNQGFDISFEGLVAKILSDFVSNSKNSKERGWICETDGMRLGCVFIAQENEVTARLRLMLVEQFAREKGIGQKLVEKAIEHSREQGFEKIVLWTQEGLKSACRLYEKNGFRLCSSKTEQLFGREVTNQTWELEL